MTKKQINEEILAILKQIEIDRLVRSEINQIIKLKYKRIDQLLEMRDDVDD